jgi:hypothetical protein
MCTACSAATGPAAGRGRGLPSGRIASPSGSPPDIRAQARHGHHQREAAAIPRRAAYVHPPPHEAETFPDAEKTEAAIAGSLFHPFGIEPPPIVRHADVQMIPVHLEQDDRSLHSRVFHHVQEKLLDRAEEKD